MGGEWVADGWQINSAEPLLKTLRIISMYLS